MRSRVSDSNSKNSNSDDDSRKLVLEAPDFDNFVTHGLQDDCGYNSDDTCKSYQSNRNNFDIQTSDVGVLPVLANQ